MKIDPREMRRIILKESRRANVGHIGSCLCVVEILAALYSSVLQADSPDDSDRDRFVLSKGHAGLALFAALYLKGWMTRAQLDTFMGGNTLLGVHPEAALSGVDFSTGSLGQGITFAVGAALAAKIQQSRRNVFCLISDAECNEGALWEAAMFAAHHRLSNLRVILDWNRVQAFGPTRDIIDMFNPTERWRAFGWEVREVHGHSLPQLKKALSSPSDDRKPVLVLAATTFGKGVSYMERGVPVTQTHLPVQPMNWHYLPMSDKEFQMAMDEVERSH